MKGFQHKCTSDDIWGDLEIACLLFVRKNLTVSPDPTEVKGYHYMTQEELWELLYRAAQGQVKVTPWFRIIAEGFLFKWWDHLHDIFPHVDPDKIQGCKNTWECNVQNNESSQTYGSNAYIQMTVWQQKLSSAILQPIYFSLKFDFSVLPKCSVIFLQLLTFFNYFYRKYHFSAKSLPLMVSISYSMGSPSPFQVQTQALVRAIALHVPFLPGALIIYSWRISPTKNYAMGDCIVALRVKLPPLMPASNMGSSSIQLLANVPGKAVKMTQVLEPLHLSGRFRKSS